MFFLFINPFAGILSLLAFLLMLSFLCWPILLLQGLSGLTFLRVVAVIIAFRIHPLLGIMIALGGLYPRTRYRHRRYYYDECC